MKNPPLTNTAEAVVAPRRRKGRPSALDPNVGQEKIIATTTALLKKYRPAELTQNLIAAKASIDPKLIRYYFGDLDGLLTIVLERLIDGLGVVMANASVSGETPTDRMRSRIVALTRYVVANPNLWPMISERVYASDSKWAKTVRLDLTKSAYMRLLSVVEDGQRQGEFSTDFDPRLLYVALLGLSEIFVTAKTIIEELIPGSRAEAEKIYVDFVVSLVMHGIAPHN